jgi:hypothetical protein
MTKYAIEEAGKGYVVSRVSDLWSDVTCIHFHHLTSGWGVFYSSSKDDVDVLKLLSYMFG